MPKKEKHRVTVRRMLLADIDRVAEIYAEVLNSTYISFSELAEGKAKDPNRLSKDAVSIFLRQVSSLIDSHEHMFLVAVDGDVVGFALASIHLAEAHHLECWVDDICVAHKRQGEGVATQLVEKVLEWGSRKKVKYFLLESGINNESAHRAFVSLGFEPLATVFWRTAADAKV
jgi:GNAT superfamily N-acetyltransferase